MRLKHVKGAEDRIAASPYVVHDEESRAGHWHEIFGNDNPIYLEIGMGKGRFLMENAARNPDINYIGMEKYATVMLRAVEKRTSEEYSDLTNVRLLCCYAEKLDMIFAPDEIDRIYLNFSDPWPKSRHAVRRLTSRQHLAEYDKVLKPCGRLEFKTDNNELFEFSLEEIKEANWKLEAMTRDLHNDPELNAGNIMTEYEEKFAAEGNPINKFIAIR